MNTKLFTIFKSILFFISLPLNAISADNKIPELSFNEIISYKEKEAFQNEPFVWKRSLIIKKEEREFSFEEIHQNLYTEIQLFRENLNLIKPYLTIFTQRILLNPHCPRKLYNIFLNLNHKSKRIGDIIQKSQTINGSFQENLHLLDSIMENKDIRTILDENLTRFEDCNACIYLS